MDTKTIDNVACTHCGQEEFTLADAAAHGWRRVRHMLLCASCTRAFPAWMRDRI